MTKLEIDRLIAETRVELKDTFSFTDTLVDNIKKYKEGMDSNEECDMRLREYSLEMGVMATAIQYSMEMTRNILYKLLGE